MSKDDQRLVLVFDRGFARARYVIKFLEDRDIPFVMHVPKPVGIRVEGSLKKLDDLEAGWYGHILYQTHEQLPQKMGVSENLLDVSILKDLPSVFRVCYNYFTLRLL